MVKRVRISVPFSGKFPHHEYRSKKGRKSKYGHEWAVRKKKYIDNIKEQRADIDIKLAKIYNG
jgi:hypothetical protein